MQRLEESVIASNYALLLLRQTRSLGIDDSRVLANTQLLASHLEGGATTLNGRQFLHMIRNINTLIPDTAFPIHYGLSMSVGTHGIMGFALLTSATARDAVQLAQRYYKTVFSIMTITEEQQDSHLHLVFDFDVALDDMEDMANFIIEGILAGMLSVSAFVLGSPSLPCVLRFRFACPPHAHLYQELFGVMPEFGCARNEIIVPASLMDTPLLTHDPLTRKMAEAQCEKMLESMEQFCSFPDRIRKILKSRPTSLPSLQDVASELNMHPRTLGRRLSEFNTCFKTLLEDVKYELAVQYLSDPDLLMDDIAYSLNYNDATSFYRAFKRWTGNPPSQYRPKCRSLR